jgi:AraC-like DNA-binding protein
MGALGRASGRAATWSVIAAESGYCDQPHLIADARELLRMTPRAFLERDAARPLVSCCV